MPIIEKDIKRLDPIMINFECACRLGELAKRWIDWAMGLWNLNIK